MPISDGPTIEADFTNAVERNGGAVIVVDITPGGSGTNNGASHTNNGGSRTHN